MSISSLGFTEGGALLDRRVRGAVEDDLFAELLGGLSKPFEIHSKKSYVYALLDEGIDGATDEFLRELKAASGGQSTDAEVGSGGSGDIDLNRLNRPLILQAKGAGCSSAAAVEMLTKLNREMKALGRSVVVYPPLVALASFGGHLARDLRSALKLTGVVPPQAVDAEVTEAFCRATRELFDIQLKTPVRFVGASIRRPGTRHDDFATGSIELEGGAVSLSAMVTLPVKVLPELMRRMSGLTQVADEIVRNGPSEFANVVGGAARGRLNSAGYALRAPTIPKAYGPESQHLLGAADSSTSVEIRLETELGECFLEIRFFT